MQFEKIAALSANLDEVTVGYNFTTDSSDLRNKNIATIIGTERLCSGIKFDVTGQV